MTNTNPTPRNPKFRRQAAWKERNLLKVRAHASLRSGLRRGLVTKQACEICGALEAEAHHEDYDRPLEVRWLCRHHHKALHAGRVKK